MMERIKNEPVLVLAVVQAAVALVAAFGLDLSGEQIAAIVTFAAAVLGLVARQQVTPTRQVAVRRDEVQDFAPTVEHETPPVR